MEKIVLVTLIGVLLCMLTGTLLLATFRLRKRLGLTMFFILLGLLKYLHFLLSKNAGIYITDELLFPLGSSIFFTAVLFSILLVYLTMGSTATRNVIYGLVGANIFFGIFQLILQYLSAHHLILNRYNLPPEFFAVPFRIFITSTLLLFIDSYLLILLARWAERNIRYLFGQIAFAMLGILLLHSLLFAAGSFAFTPRFVPSLIVAVLSKLVPWIIYSTLFWLYLRYIDYEELLQVRKNDLTAVELWQLFTTLKRYEFAYQSLPKETRMAAEESEFSKDLFQLMPSGAVLLDEKLNIAACNRAFADTFGISQGCTGKSFLSMIHKPGKSFLEQLAKAIRQRKRVTVEANLEIAVNPKQRKEVYFIAHRVQRAGKNYLLAMVTDLSEQVRLLKEKENTLELFRLATRFGKVAVWKFHALGRQFWRSDNFDLLFGKEYPANARFEDYRDQVLEEDIAGIRSHISDRPEDLRTGKINFSFRIRKPDGTIAWLSVTGEMSGNITDGVPETAHGCLIDITELAEANEKLAQQSRFLNQLIDRIPLQVFWKDQDMIFQGCNNAFAHAVGEESPEGVIGKTDHELKVGSAFATHYQAWDWNVLESGKPALDIEEFYFDAEGRKRFARTSKVPLFDNDGNITGILGISQDITEKKEAELQLKASDERYRRIFNDTPVSLWQQDFTELYRYFDKLRAQGVSDLNEWFENNPREVEKCTSLIRVLDVNKATLSLFEARFKEEVLSSIDLLFTESTYNAFREELIVFWNGATLYEGKGWIKTLRNNLKEVEVLIHVNRTPQKTYDALLVFKELES
ncbi:MAG: hypothetical protein Kow00127_09400 [Bacteroidales bacterium]